MTCATITLTDLYGDWAFTPDSAIFTGHPNELCSGDMDAEYAGFAFATGTGMPFDGSTRVLITGHVEVTGGTDPSIFIGLQSDDETGSSSGFDASSAGTNIYSWDDFDGDAWDLSTGIDWSLEFKPDDNEFVAIIDGNTYTQTLGTWPVADRSFVISGSGNNCGVTVSVTDICITIGAGFYTPSHDSLTYQPTCLVFVDGDLIDEQRLEAHTVHGVENPVATATVVLSKPVPASVVFNKVVEIQAQIGNESGRIFQGVIRSDNDTLGESEMTATLNCQGWGYILAMPAIEDTVWDGPISARAVIIGVLATYGFGAVGGPQYEVKNLTNLSGDLVLLGGNADVDAGQVRWEKGTSGLDFINRIANLWGYHGYDCPDGIFRVTRSVGAPTGTAVKVWNEGEDILTGGRTRSADEIANWIEVTGASPLPADGTRPDPYSSTPASVSANELIPEPGAKYMAISDDLLVSDDACEDVRHIAELRFNSETPATMYDITDIGHPRLRPGRKITVVSDTLDISQSMWLWSLSQDLTSDGYWITVTVRRDLGDSTPEGDEICTDTTLIDDDDPRHLGDETLAYYDVDAPEGTEIHFNFTPAADFTSIHLTYEAHGVNSYLIGGGNTGSDVSKFRIEQPVGDEIGSGVMPLSPENYGDPPDWQEFEIPIPGSLEGGTAARLYITSGNNPDAVLGPYDDFEIRKLVLSTCTEGVPTLPGGPSNPPIPIPVPPAPTPPVCNFSSAGGDVDTTLVIQSSPWVWPAGYDWLLVTGNATDLTGTSRDAMLADELTLPTQAVGIATIGGNTWPLIVPGTQTIGAPERTGTALVGAGAFQVWIPLNPTDDQVINAALLFAAMGIGAGIGAGPAETFSVSDCCAAFTSDSSIGT